MAAFGNFWHLLPTFEKLLQLIATYGNSWQFLRNIVKLWQSLAVNISQWPSTNFSQLITSISLANPSLIGRTRL